MYMYVCWTVCVWNVKYKRTNVYHVNNVSFYFYLAKHHLTDIVKTRRIKLKKVLNKEKDERKNKILNDHPTSSCKMLLRNTPKT